MSRAAPIAPLWRRLIWMAVIWGLSVAAVAAVGLVLHVWLGP